MARHAHSYDKGHQQQTTIRLPRLLGENMGGRTYVPTALAKVADVLLDDAEKRPWPRVVSD